MCSVALSLFIWLFCFLLHVQLISVLPLKPPPPPPPPPHHHLCLPVISKDAQKNIPMSGQIVTNEEFRRIVSLLMERYLSAHSRTITATKPVHKSSEQVKIWGSNNS